MKRTFVGLLAIAACAAGVAFATDPAQGTGEARVNPHGASDQCASCHLPAPAVPADGSAPGTAATVGAAMPVVATCRGCHPTADMHPVGMAPSKIHVPDGFPLEDGKVVCSTCHAEPAHGGAVAQLTAPYHRGGPYGNPRQLCWSCHERAPFEKTDPHHPATARDPQAPTCSACHTVAPKPGAPVAASRLRLDADQTCTATCHTTETHAGVAEHLGKTVPESARAGLPATIALLPDGKIACFTCHEVHGDGGASAPRTPSPLAAALRAHNASPETWPGEHAPTEHAPLLAAPVTDGSLCRACHGDGP